MTGQVVVGMSGGVDSSVAALLLQRAGENVAGMFMDAITIMFICLPIFLPVAQKLGWDPIWFGVVVMINLAIGLFTPPVGINLYVAANITRLPLEKVARGALPFLLTSILGLAIVASVPEMSSFLVDWLK